MSSSEPRRMVRIQNWYLGALTIFAILVAAGLALLLRLVTVNAHLDGNIRIYTLGTSLQGASGFWNNGAWQWINYPPSNGQYTKPWNSLIPSMTGTMGSQINAWDARLPNNEWGDSACSNCIPPESKVNLIDDTYLECGPACTVWDVGQLLWSDKGGWYQQGATIYMDYSEQAWDYSGSTARAVALLHEIGHTMGLYEQYKTAFPNRPGCNDTTAPSIMDTALPDHTQSNLLTGGCDGSTIQTVDGTRLQDFYKAFNPYSLSLTRDNLNTARFRWYDSSFGEWGYYYRLYVCGKSCSSLVDYGSWLSNVARANYEGATQYHDKVFGGLQCNRTYRAEVHAISYMYPNSSDIVSPTLYLNC